MATNDLSKSFGNGTKPMRTSNLMAGLMARGAELENNYKVLRSIMKKLSINEFKDAKNYNCVSHKDAETIREYFRGYYAAQPKEPEKLRAYDALEMLSDQELMDGLIMRGWEVTCFKRVYLEPSGATK